MNADDVLKYGHSEIVRIADVVPLEIWETPGVCGRWTVKDVLAHLDSYEHMLIDMVATLRGEDPGPVLRQRIELGDEFNDQQVAQYQDMAPRAVFDTYCETCERARALVAEIPAETLRQPGTLPHYGEEYAFDDMLVYQYYGHKREHKAQIAAFHDRLGG